MSARPLRAPCVELKYSSTVSPSLKLEMMGCSMISPDGFAISPRMPANWRICAGEPRAPECDIIHTLLVGTPASCLEISRIIADATSSVQRDQASTTLL